MKYLLVLAACAVAVALGAQPVTYYSNTAGGYDVSQTDLAVPGPGSNSVPGGVAWDPAGSDVYYYDAGTVSIRRFDTTLNQPAGTALYNVPNPVFGPYVDDMEFDPNITSDLYFIESGAQLIYKLRRSGPDSLDTGFGTGGVQTGPTLPFYPFDLTFDGYSRLFCIGANSFGTAVSGVYFVDRTTLAVTQVVDLLTAAGTDISGPIAFDSSGNLLVLLPPPYPSVYPLRIVKFGKQSLDNAIASSTPLTVADGNMVIDAAANFPNGGRAAMHVEAAHDVLYFTGLEGSVYRWDTATGGYTQFGFANPAQGTDTNYPTSIAFEPSGGFQPYSGGGARLAVMMATRDAGYAIQQTGLCIFRAQGATGTVDSLAITDQPFGVVNGSSFRCEIELRDASNTLLTNETGGVSVQILSGAGTLSGTTYRVTAGGVAVFDDLELTGASGSVILRFSLAGTGIEVDTSALNVSGSSSSSSNGGSSGGGSGCTTGNGAGWGPLLALLAFLGVAIRLRRARG